MKSIHESLKVFALVKRELHFFPDHLQLRSLSTPSLPLKPHNITSTHLKNSCMIRKQVNRISNLTDSTSSHRSLLLLNVRIKIIRSAEKDCIPLFRNHVNSLGARADSFRDVFDLFISLRVDCDSVFLPLVLLWSKVPDGICKSLFHGVHSIWKFFLCPRFNGIKEKFASNFNGLRREDLRELCDTIVRIF